MTAGTEVSKCTQKGTCGIAGTSFYTRLRLTVISFTFYSLAPCYAWKSWTAETLCMLTINACTINYVRDPVSGTSNVAMIKIRSSPSNMHSLWKIEVSPLKVPLVHFAL